MRRARAMAIYACVALLLPMLAAQNLY